MVDAPKAEIPSVRIVQDVPVVFADAIGSQSFGFGVVKMYLTRFDPDPGLVGPSKEVTVCQVVMPLENFVRTVAFLEFRLNQMVQLGAVNSTIVEEARKVWRENPATGTPNA
jgi:hypothetical protein